MEKPLRALYSQFGTAFAATAQQYLAASGRSRTHEKSMGDFALTFFGLVGSFHEKYLYTVSSQFINTREGFPQVCAFMQTRIMP